MAAISCRTKALTECIYLAEEVKGRLCLDDFIGRYLIDVITAHVLNEMKSVGGLSHTKKEAETKTDPQRGFK